ncbi:MAG TPA: alpha/beta hydrolase [Burkholderiaceae bacterium]|nr:alpha/beta hydrolase [Burkholderiaceae bacterium]
MDLVETPRLYAYTGGKAFDPALPTIVFLHGGQHDHSVWILQSRYMAHHGYSVLALDLPGHMRSAGPALQTIESMAAVIAAALEACSAQRLILVGHSMGSLIVLELATLLRERVHGAVLIATACPMRVSDELLNATQRSPPHAMDMINVWSHSASIGAFDRKPSNPGPGFSNVWSNLRLMQRIAQRNGSGVLHADFAACNAYRNGPQAAADLACPVLFILGASDSMTPARSAKPLIDACKDCSVITLPGSGHSLMAENPDGVRDALQRFAARAFELERAPV